jgi:NADH-quinone oxidoreductase subunit M
LIWGNGDAEERKSSGKILIYTLAGSLFMLVAFVYMYQNGKLIEDLYDLDLTATNNLDFLAFFLAYALKFH